MKTCNSCFSVYHDELDVCPYCGYVEGMPAKELYHLYPGMIITERYIVGKVLGFGGFGITYKAWDKKLNHIVAVKEFFPNGLVNRMPGEMEVILYSGNKLTEYKKGLTRFLEEARNMSNFNSQENIVNVYDFFEANSTAYIVMEYLDGVTLKDFLKSNDTLIGDDLILRIITNILDGLSAIHKKGIVHRDISPDNIFICSNNKIKIIDFGAAQFASEDEKTRAVVLKPGYAPPEQYRTKSRQGPWTDIYAVGATMYYLVTGIIPEESTDRVIKDELIEPVSIRAEIPIYINNSIMKAMSINEELRFRSADEFKKALFREKEVRTIKEELRRRRIQRVLVVAAALVLIGTSAVFFVDYVKERSSTLKDAVLSIWIPESDDVTATQNRLSVLTELSGKFRDTYSNISFDIKAIPADEYPDRLLSNEGPVLFDSSALIPDIDITCLDISDIYMNSTCIGAVDYGNSPTDRHMVPLGFIVPVEYVKINSERNDSQESANEVKELGDFLIAQNASWISDTSHYFTLLTNIPGRYRVKEIETKQSECVYTQFWSIRKSSKAQNDAAVLWLEYLLSDNAKDAIHVQNRSNALPVNKNTLSIFCNVYNELNFIYDQVDTCQFKNEIY